MSVTRSPACRSIAREFRGRDEPAPVMGADRQPAQQVFGADLGGQERPRRAVQGGQEQQAARRQQAGQRRHEGGRVGHVLDHLERGDHREARAFAPAGPRRRRRGRSAAGPAPRHGRAPPRSPRRRHRGRARRSPRRASASAARPAPQPTSSRRSAERRAAGSRAMRRQRGRAIQPIRAGFIRCSGRIGPFGSHQRGRQRVERARSPSGETVVPGMVAPAVPRQYDHPEPDH